MARASSSPPAAAPSQFLGRQQAAALLSVDPQTIDKLIRLGHLRAYRVGRRVLIKQDELLRMVEAGEVR